MSVVKTDTVKNWCSKKLIYIYMSNWIMRQQQEENADLITANNVSKY